MNKFWPSILNYLKTVLLLIMLFYAFLDHYKICKQKWHEQLREGGGCPIFIDLTSSLNF